jgi:cytochrome c oxidase subunit 2
MPIMHPKPKRASCAKALTLLAAFLAAPLAAFADATPAATAAPIVMSPHRWQLGMQAAHSPVQANIESLNHWVTIIIVVITAFVAGLLGWVIWRYNATRNPVPSSISHNSTLEAAWTIIPVLILVGIFIPSLRLVYYEDRTYDADMTLKVTGHQWYWEYTYPDAGDIHFESRMVDDDDLKGDEKHMRHLLVDNQLVLPAGKNIRILTTSSDVIHSFFIPSLGVQRYAIPGRTIETWVRIDRPGDYYGECNQICGMNHSMMPIGVHAVTPEAFKTWLATAKTKFQNASNDQPARFAQAETAPGTER